MRPRRLHRVESAHRPDPPQRTHPLPGTPWCVGWAPETESYYITGADAPTTGGVLPSVEDLAAVVAPTPIPAQVREALHADRAVRPPIADSWRRRVDTIGAVLAPLGTALRMVVPHILGDEAAQAVHVQVDPDIPAAAETARRLVEEAGYGWAPHGTQQSGAYLVTRSRRADESTAHTDHPRTEEDQ